MLSPTTAPSGRLDAVPCEDREEGTVSPRLGFRAPGRIVRAWNSGSMEKQRRAWLVQKRKQRVVGGEMLGVGPEGNTGWAQHQKGLGDLRTHQGPSLHTAERRKCRMKVLVSPLCRALRPHGL